MTREDLAVKIYNLRQALQSKENTEYALDDNISVYYTNEAIKTPQDCYSFAFNQAGILRPLMTVPVSKLSYSPLCDEIIADVKSFAPDEAVPEGTVRKLIAYLDNLQPKKSLLLTLTPNISLVAYFQTSDKITTQMMWHFKVGDNEYTCSDYAMLDKNTIFVISEMLNQAKKSGFMNNKPAGNQSSAGNGSGITLEVIKELFPIENINPAADKLRKDFQEKDKMLVLLYFRWLTRKGARDMGLAHLERSLEMSDTTKEWLAKQGLSEIDDWEFTGMTDHGSTQAGITCSHGGHRLRYAYHAYSPSADKELLFGINCGSEFFQVDLGVLSKLEAVLANAKEELKACFSLGRCPGVMPYLSTYNILTNIQRRPELAELCLTYIGRTQLELWLNFINRGILPPRTLSNLVQSGYETAMLTYLQAHCTLNQPLAVYRNVKANEAVGNNTDIRGNKGMKHTGEFIYPLTRCNLFDAVRAIAIEELINPSAISTSIDMVDFLAKIDVLESESKEYTLRMGTPTMSRAEIIYNYAMKTEDNLVRSPLEALLLSLNRNDLRLAQFFFGLGYVPKGAEPPYRQEVWKGKSEYFLITRLHPRRRLILLLIQGYYNDLLKALQDSVPIMKSSASSDISDYNEDLDEDFFEYDDEEEFYDESDESITGLADLLQGNQQGGQD